MLMLLGTTDELQVESSIAADLQIHASWATFDDPTTVTPGRTNSLMTTATTAVVVAAPGANLARKIKMLSIKNVDTTDSTTVTVIHDDGTNPIDLYTHLLFPGDILHYIEGIGFTFFSSGLQGEERFRLAGDHSLTSTTAEEITGLTVATETGLYVYEYHLAFTSAATTTSPKWDVNHDGTEDLFVNHFQWIDTSNATSTSQDQDVVLAGGNITSGFARRAKNTAGIVGVGVDTASAACYTRIIGIVHVTVAGNLELWGGTEVGASAIVVLAGSSLILRRTGS